MPNVNISEIVLLLALGVIIFGPEKLPDLARKTARLLKFLRGVANNAQESVRRELGPEYADFRLTDLQPRNLARKLMAEDYDAIEAEIRGVRTDVDALRDEVRDQVADEDLEQRVAQTVVVAAPSHVVPRWDVEAT